MIGLGNPGKNFNRTRHNVGFMLLDVLVENFTFHSFTEKFNGLISTGNIEGNKFTLFKPNTFINNSGEPLLKLVSFYKIHPEKIIVIHDDVDLIFGKVKVKQGGGSAGHNGLKSIDKYIGNDYWRVRIGVGKPVFGELSDYVLAKFTKNENITDILQKISDNFLLLLNENKSLFMQSFNREL
ncbi:MAG: aminoacyl-tRNA hydrolase [Rickettsiaceae bacterium H1]|nr:aminoacyl-tRNA hydrolase [Rickettsiaceae bacterium H1]